MDTYLNAFSRIVIGVDPAVTSYAHSDETGIIVVGRTEIGETYILEDLSCQGSPHFWATRIVEAYHYYKADRVVGEVNQGGDLVENLLRSLDPTISFKGVRATRGKSVRAEPIVALYEQGKIFHLKPFSQLEEQMCTYIPGKSKKSPDRMDALVWALTDLCLQPFQTHVLRIGEL